MQNKAVAFDELILSISMHVQVYTEEINWFMRNQLPFLYAQLWPFSSAKWQGWTKNKAFLQVLQTAFHKTAVFHETRRT